MGRLYVANTGSNSVSVINSLSLKVSKTISLSSTITAADQTPSPVWIASDSESLKVFTANRDSRNASVILTSKDSEVSDANGNPVRIPAPNIDPTDSTCTT